MKSLALCAFGLLLVLAVSACDNGSDSTTTTPAVPTTTETLTGVVPAAVNGVQQSSFVKFTVGQAGTVTLALTLARESLPDGSFDSSVVVGIAIGLQDSTGTSCTLSTGVTSIKAGPDTYTIDFSAAASACIQVSDLTVQTGPVNYTLVVTHP